MEKCDFSQNTKNVIYFKYLSVLNHNKTWFYLIDCNVNNQNIMHSAEINVSNPSSEEVLFY